MNLLPKHKLSGALLLLFAVQILHTTVTANSLSNRLVTTIKSTNWQDYKELFESGSMVSIQKTPQSQSVNS